jgi:Zn-dependent protease with chaperone function
MIYTNLLSFLIVIFVLSIAETPVRPMLAPQLGLPLFALILFAYYRLAGREHRNMLHWGGTTRYFSAEKKLTLLAVLFFAFSVFSFDLKYYLEPLSLGGRLPVLTDSGGLLLFFLFLILMWLQARTNYLTLFGGKYSPASFVSLNLRASLPIILPWLLLSLSFDLLLLLPFPSLHRFLDSAWGNLLIILPALLLALVFLPALVWRLWNCSPLPPGPQRSMIEKFCRRQNFSASILRWPLYEGRMLTAAVMGLAPGLRYLLLTPALLDLLDQEELESVLAHEIGHIRHRHLLLYLFLLLGFSVLAETLAQQFLVLFFSSSWFWRFALWSKVAAERLAESLTGAALLLLLALFFRFLFGWFIRNFERQADLHAFRAQQSSQPLIRAFEKIAAMSGNIREQKNWHHFGIGERIDFLARCEHRPVLARQHDRKVRLALAAYFLLIGLTVWLAPAPDRDIVNRRTRAAQLEALLHHAPEGSSHDQQEIY